MKETKLRNIKQATQGYPAWDGLRLAQDYLPLSIRYLLVTIRKNQCGNPQSTALRVGSFLYIQVSSTLHRAHDESHSGTRTISGQASFLFLRWPRSWRTSVGTRAESSSSAESAHVGVLAQTIWTKQNLRPHAWGKVLKRNSGRREGSPRPQYGCEE